MVLSIFLAKTIGLYLLIVSTAFMLKADEFKPMMLDMLKNQSIVSFSGILALIFGILIVVSHNIWVMDWRVIITILGWLTLLKGVMRLFYPEFVMKKATKCVENKASYNIMMLITLFIGLVLLYFGYVG
ncbi:MAG: hypothetical protein K2X28_01500 [Alphaproteobacteria bacterium]|nr:hypothetical protein [Alphaproteobacteria bacterium]